MQTNERAIAERLLQIQAIKLNSKEPFTWASGWKSPIYCDNRKILSFPYVREFVKSEMSNLIFQEFAQSELLAGVATAGIAWGAMVADQLKLPFVYVRPKPKEHGLGNQIEGSFEKGQKTVVIEDLISTGKSSLQVVEVLRKSGLDVIGMVSIFTYGFEEAKKSFEEAGLPYRSLTNYETLIQLGVEKGQLGEDEQTILLNWRKDPSHWQPVI